MKSNRKSKKKEDSEEDDSEFSPEELSDEDDQSSSNNSDDDSSFEQDFEAKTIKKQSRTTKKTKDDNPDNSEVQKSKNNKNKNKTTMTKEQKEIEKNLKKQEKEKEKQAKKELKEKEKAERTKRKEEEKIEKENKKKQVLDINFDINKSYFYQYLLDHEKKLIKDLISSYMNEVSSDISEVSSNVKILVNQLVEEIPNLGKSKENLDFLQEIINSEGLQNASKYSSKDLFVKINTLNQHIMNQYYKMKPTVQECHFFPNKDNEAKVANMLRTAKKTLDIAIFALTNDALGAAIVECFTRGVLIRIIADDECAKFQGGEIYKLAQMGIPTKTDNSFRFHMHHKFAVIDKSVVVTGSFNWTSQAVKFNQENILFYECKEIALDYTNAYNDLWEQFTTEITPTIANKLLKDQEEEMKKRFEKGQETKKKNKEAQS